MSTNTRFTRRSIEELLELMTLRAEVVQFSENMKVACAGTAPGSDEAMEVIEKLSPQATELIERVSEATARIRNGYGPEAIPKDVEAVLVQGEGWVRNERNTMRLLKLVLDLRKGRPVPEPTSFKPTRGLA